MTRDKPSPRPAAAPNLRPMIEAALRFHEAGRLPEAIAGYRNALRLAPKNFDALNLLGVALTQSGNAAEGVAQLRKAVEANPASANGRLNLANALIAQQDFAAAAGLLQKLLAQGAASEAAFRGFAQALNELTRSQEAGNVAGHGLQRFPRSAGLHNELGRAHAALGQISEAAGDYRRAIALDPAFLPAACNLGNALTELKQFEEAEAVLNKVLAAEPRNVQALTNLAHLFRTNWQAERAIATAERALAISPGDAGLSTFIGGCLIDLGRNDEAEKVFRGQIARGEKLQEALIGLSQIHKFKAGEPEIAAVDRLLAGTALAPKERKPLLFAKAKIEDDLGHHGAAIEAAIAAKAIAPFPDHFAEHQRYIRACMALMDAKFFAARRPLALQTETPVFILGMPRSGTTLTEQIIASHPQADGAGELTALPAVAESIGFRRLEPKALVEKLAAASAADIAEWARPYLAVLEKSRKEGALRITDKLPHNFENIWLIAQLFPNARIIHCDRNPVDVCISIFLRNFSEGHWYTRDLATLGKFYNLYRESTAHWKSVCGLRWYENDYEALVGEPEPNIRAMIDFLGLPWDERCLDHTGTERSVHTFSKWQVRQPIYKSSVERWRKYADHIGPLLDELGIKP